MPNTSISDVQKTPIFPGKHASGLCTPYFIVYSKGILYHHFKVAGLTNLPLLTGSRGQCSAIHHTLFVGYHIFNPIKNNMVILDIGIPPNTV